jgi:3-isopropylmalate/(R)-2-methylmalate dehydratase small subunit
MKISGKAIVFGDNINTDLIIPSRYLTTLDPIELSKHTLESSNPNFTEKAKKGVIMIVGKNFGCGSSREQAPIALKYSGVLCILGESFARIFYRNAINIGLPVIEISDLFSKIEEGDFITVNLNDSSISNLTKKSIIKFPRIPSFILEIIKDGGLIQNLRKKELENEV